MAENNRSFAKNRLAKLPVKRICIIIFITCVNHIFDLHYLASRISCKGRKSVAGITAMSVPNIN